MSTFKYNKYSYCRDCARTCDPNGPICCDCDLVMKVGDPSTIRPSCFTDKDDIKIDTAAVAKATNNVCKALLNSIYGSWANYVPPIKDIRFNGPATIVFWRDGTKTVVKCGEGDIYDPEKGIAMAIAKKALGNKHDYFDVIDRYTKRYYKERKRNEKKEAENG